MGILIFSLVRSQQHPDHCLSFTDILLFYRNRERFCCCVVVKLLKNCGLELLELVGFLLSLTRRLTMATAAPPSPKLGRYVIIHVATTCDEHGVYVTKDSAEVIELGWILLDSKTCDEIYRESVLVKPVNTPITPLCTSLTTLTWEHVRNAGSSATP